MFRNDIEWVIMLMQRALNTFSKRIEFAPTGKFFLSRLWNVSMQKWGASICDAVIVSGNKSAVKLGEQALRITIRDIYHLVLQVLLNRNLEEV